MYRYSWLINVGCICGLIIFVGALAPKENTVTGPHAPNVVLADGKWALSNKVKHQVCSNSVLKLARDTKNLNDADHLEVAKSVYWECMVNLGGAL